MNTWGKIPAYKYAYAMICTKNDSLWKASHRIYSQGAILVYTCVQVWLWLLYTPKNKPSSKSHTPLLEHSLECVYMNTRTLAQTYNNVRRINKQLQASHKGLAEPWD